MGKFGLHLPCAGLQTVRMEEKKDRSALDGRFVGEQQLLVDFGKQVEDVVPWVTVESGLETFLVHVVSDHTDGTSEQEESVETTGVDDFLDTLTGESTSSHHVDHEDTDGTVDVEDECVFLLGCDLLDFESVVEQVVLRKVFERVFFEQLDTLVGVAQGFDTVSNPLDIDLLFFLDVDEFFWAPAVVICFFEHDSRASDSTTKAWSNGQHTGCDGAHQVTTCASSDDRVVCTGDSGSVVSSQLDDDLHELCGPGGKFLFEPQQGDDITERVVFADDLADL